VNAIFIQGCLLAIVAIMVAVPSGEESSTKRILPSRFASSIRLETL
jgi:hypothetical protein